MPSVHAAYAPNLEVFIASLKRQPLETSIETFISLLKRRQIRGSRPCAQATVQLLLRVVEKFKWTDIDKLIQRIQQVGSRLMAAQPKEMVVGNIVRRVLGMIRDEAKEAEENTDYNTLSSDSSPRPLGETEVSLPERPKMSSSISTLSPLHHTAIEMPISGSHPTIPELGRAHHKPNAVSRPPLMASHTSYAILNGVPLMQSMFNLLSENPSPTSSPSGTHSPMEKSPMNGHALVNRISSSTQDLKAEIILGVEEIIDELDQVDDQIAEYALNHIHSHEIILTYTSSRTVQTFLLTAAKKRFFTVVHVEAYPNDHENTHQSLVGKSKEESESSSSDDDEQITEEFEAALTRAGVEVVLITDSAVFALMSRVNKVILGTHAIMANGGLVAAAGARTIAQAAKKHRTPVIVLGGLYKLSPQYPFSEQDDTIEYGDTTKIIPFEDGDLVEQLDTDNPLHDYVPPRLVDLYITNLGAHAPSYLYRIVADNYKAEDVIF